MLWLSDKGTCEQNLQKQNDLWKMFTFSIHLFCTFTLAKKRMEGKVTVITANRPLSSAMVSVKDGDLMGVSESSQCTLAIVPVKVKVSNTDKIIHTHAFLDPGSSATFCTDSLKRKLNFSGKNATILLCTVGQEKPVHSSVGYGLEVSNTEGLMYHKRPEVYTQTKLPVSKQHIPT